MSFPDDATAALLQQAVAAHRAGDLRWAEDHCRALLKIDPHQFDARHLLGLLLFQRGQFEEAEANFGRAMALRPNHAGVADLHGMALAERGRHTEAVASYDRAIAAAPYLSEAHFHRGNALAELSLDDDACVSFERAIRHKPDHWQAFYNRGLALMRLKRPTEALASFDAAIAFVPGLAQAFNNRGAALMELERIEEARTSFDTAIALAPALAEAFSNRGNAHFAQRRYAEALADYDQALARSLDKPFLPGARLHAKMHVCDWTAFALDCALLLSQLEAGKPVAAPFAILPIASTPASQLACARIYIAREHPASRTPLWQGERYDHGRIRLAYVSGALRHHPTMVLAGGLFEHHDKTRFETVAISFSGDDGSAARLRAERAFDKFIDVRGRSDREIATLMREMEIDIAVDLDGLIQGSRPGIFAGRPAPLQVGYLGFPATTGAPYIDYMLADRIVLPPHQRAHFSEKIVYLPGSYQPNTGRAELGAPPLRQDCGLPVGAFVFCCFNSSYKITPDLFDIWMRLLHDVPGSVLWLLDSCSAARANLIAEARARGIEAARLVFAPIASLEENLARQQLADLFLDTLYYNAHTTASDALWAGLPLVTCAGESFASRVAASVLIAAGLQDLVAHNRQDYEALARAMARDPARLTLLKEKLRGNRAALFDVGQTAKRLDMAFEAMTRRLRDGLPPESFSVDPTAET